MGLVRLRCGLAAAMLPMLALACAQPDGPPPAGESVAAAPSGAQSTAAAPRNHTPIEPPLRLDVQTANVPLDEVLFDTFQGGFIRLSEASDSAIERLRDAIKPIYEPVYDPVEGGDWLNETDMVIGYAGESVAYAYPTKILNLHEIVNDYIDDVPVLVSYCPLCASGVVYDRRLEGRVLLFGNTSALYESDLVMYGHQTGSYWFQVLGEAIVGGLTGERLTMLPSMALTWGEWKRLHPDTLVLSVNLGLLRDGEGPYLNDPFASYAARVSESGPSFPTNPITDARLLPGDRAFAIQAGDSHKAYALRTGPDWLVNDHVGGRDVLVIGRGGAGVPSAAAYFREVDGRPISFKFSGEQIKDDETGSVWDGTGLAVSGPLAGTRLEQAPSRTSLWFSLAGALPGIEMYQP